ncbi:archaea-specific SMC-related protein [Halosimplex pelagicum]|uniref:AAA family ATPase n=1 Tax=Halosimplex pelagicum TaxID=869886 RepID=A0A7D5PB66_9EURY|nr:archaea-specific SMC-related protein [Halosimplex pelagicum]QLH82042.1 AAA family ATPase [Halosimplex pelagicum]
MSTPLSTTDSVQLSVENIGGIDESSVSFSPGVTILAGRNATNRTSLLQSLMAGLGSEGVSIKGDVDEAHVELTIGDETYSRMLTRTNGDIYAEGDAYLDNPELADLFVFLLEANEARRAVELQQDLRELIMRPVDTAAIEAEIEDLQAQRDDVERQLENLDSLQRELPTLEQRRQDLKQEIEEKEAELETTKEAIEDADQELSATRNQKDELDDALEAFRDTRSELEDTRRNLETERESIAALESELDELESELEDLPETPMAGVDEVSDRLDELRSQREDLDDVANSLQKIIQFNEEMLEGTDSDVVAALRGENEDPTDRLVDEQVVCWTCGSTVDSDAIEETLDRLRDIRSEKLQERREIQSKMDDLKTEKATYEEQQRQRTQLEDRLKQVQAEIKTRRERVEDLETDREHLEDEIDDLEAEVETLQDETQSDLLDLHREANQIEFELGQLQDDLDQVSSEIDRIDDELEKRDDLKARREEISDEIADLRTRIDQVESEAVEQFNEHMETVLEILGYENLERIWIERRQETVSQGRRTVEQAVFELHVVRSTADGTTYEDTVDHLSESEREVTGLVFALAGYLTHDVYETCPFLLLDSIEAIDSNRIARLIDYVADFAEYVVVALLPEDAQALDDEYHRLSEI